MSTPANPPAGQQPAGSQVPPPQVGGTPDQTAGAAQGSAQAAASQPAQQGYDPNAQQQAAYGQQAYGQQGYDPNAAQQYGSSQAGYPQQQGYPQQGYSQPGQYGSAQQQYGSAAGQPYPAQGYSQPAQYGSAQQFAASAPQSYGYSQPYAQQAAVQPYGANGYPTPVVPAGVSEYIDIPGRGPVQLASMGQRFMARVLDGLVLALGSGLIIGLFAAIGSVGGGAAGSAEDAAGGGLMGILFGLVIVATVFAFYELIMVWFWGATVGKMLTKIVVVRTADGRMPGFFPSLLRYIIPGLCAYIPFIGSIGTALCFLSPSFDSGGRRQGWHDKVANTVVVRR